MSHKGGKAITFKNLKKKNNDKIDYAVNSYYLEESFSVQNAKQKTHHQNFYPLSNGSHDCN